MLRATLCAFCGRLVSERHVDTNGECVGAYALDCAASAPLRASERRALADAWRAWLETKRERSAAR